MRLRRHRLGRQSHRDWCRRSLRLRTQLETIAVAEATEHIDKATIRRLEELNAEIAFLGGGEQLSRINELDREFHHLVFAAAQDEPRLASIEFTRNAFAFYALWRDSARVATSVKEHNAILRALDKRDADAAAKAHGRHLDSGLKAALRTLKTKAMS